MTARAPMRRIHSRSRLAFDAPDGRTRLAVSDCGAPLRVMRGFELPDGRLLVQIISAAPGLFSGDRYELDLEVSAGARAVVLTPAATKIHSMRDGGRATQTIRATVAAGGSLEVYPTLSIPFAVSDFEQDATVAIEGDGRFGWLDPWSFGRIGSGEANAYRRVATRLRVNRDGRPLYRDAMELAPAESDVSGWGMLEGATHALSGCWFGPSEAWTPEGVLDAGLVTGVLGADGLYARGLFGDGRAFRSALEDLRERVVQAWDVGEISQMQFTL